MIAQPAEMGVNIRQRSNPGDIDEREVVAGPATSAAQVASAFGTPRTRRRCLVRY